MHLLLYDEFCSGHDLALFFLEKQRMSGQSTGALPAKYVVIFQQDQFYNLVLVHHMDSHVAGLGLRSQEGRAEHNGHALCCHPVRFSVFYHSEGKTETHRFMMIHLWCTSISY